MDMKKVKNTPREHRKTIVLSVRVTPHILEWLKKNQISITKICGCAITELGYKAAKKE